MKKKKYLFGEKEFERFNKTFWTNDDAAFVHPRNKVQIAFIISVFCWTGARIGAFFPKPKNKHVRGLRYRVSLRETILGNRADQPQDVEVVLKRIPSGGWKTMYRIDQRWVKNNRNPESTT